MSAEADDVELYARAAARLHGLSLSDDSLAAVVANLRLLRARAGEFVDLDLPEGLDPAGLLRP